MCKNPYCDKGLPCPCGDACRCNVISVKVAKKTKKHPFYGVGSDYGFVVNGVEGGPMTIKRGVDTLIEMNEPEHPLLIIDDKEHGQNTEPRTMSHTVNLPAYLQQAWYRCARHDLMGGIVNLL